MDETREFDPEFEALLDHIHRNHGFDFRGYKRSSLRRRIEKRMKEVGRTEYGDYLALLEAEPREYAQLVNMILINVTGFFRDEAAWEALKEKALPDILGSRDAPDPIRVWSAGCATGEEACSLAILLAEALGFPEFLRRVKIYATDIDEAALATARNAVYPASAVGAVPDGLLDRYFEETGSSFTFRRELRKGIIFGRHNLLSDPPISRINLLACRNLLIYLDIGTQAQVLPRLHYALTDDGFLFLGKAETQIANSKLFETVDMRSRLFRKRAASAARAYLGAFSPPVGPASREAPAPAETPPRLFEEMVDTLPVAAIGVAADGHLLVANTAARRLFELVERDIGRQLQDLQISYRPLELRGRIEEAIKSRSGVRVDDVEFARLGGEAAVRLCVQVMPHFENGQPAGVSVSFLDVTRFYDLQRQLDTANHMIETTMEELQSANEELEITNEEIQSTNEELETTNEELQSTNEELETTNEELKSTNEELEAMNEELRARSEQLERQRAYTEIVLGSIGTGIVVTDRELRVTSWNRWNEITWGLRREEAVGRPLLELDIGLPVARIEDRLRLVLAGERETDRVTLQAVDRRGRSAPCIVILSALRGDGNPGVAGTVLVVEGAAGTVPTPAPGVD
jgi:two-component system CheB/CheR fusion protein